jgi:hypothetical protein
MGIVPTFDEAKQRLASLSRRMEGFPFQQFTLQGGEETLAQGVIETITTEPMEGRTPASRQRLPKASDVYWLP